MSISSDLRRQRGDVLIEALIGVLITAFLGAGLAYVASRVSASQYSATMERIAVEQMRSQLQARGLTLCGEKPDAGTILDAAHVGTAVCQDAAELSVTIAGETYAVTPPPEISLSITDAGLGGDGKGALTVSSQAPPAAVPQGDG